MEVSILALEASCVVCILHFSSFIIRKGGGINKQTAFLVVLRSSKNKLVVLTTEWLPYSCRETRETVVTRCFLWYGSLIA